MAKIYPCRPSYSPSSSSSSSFFCSNTRESFTIHMKSLVLNSNGYTVYDSNGNIIFRIDNYDYKCSSKVYLMDLQGNVVCTIVRKKLLRFGLWDCYKNNDTRLPWFSVQKIFNLFNNDSIYDVLVGSNNTQSRSNSYNLMEGLVHKSEFKITDGERRVAAKVQRKISTTGVVLGEDVMSVTVEPCVDQVFVMALVAIHGLIRRKM